MTADRGENHRQDRQDARGGDPGPRQDPEGLNLGGLQHGLAARARLASAQLDAIINSKEGLDWALKKARELAQRQARSEGLEQFVANAGFEDFEPEAVLNGGYERCRRALRRAALEGGQLPQPLQRPDFDPRIYLSSQMAWHCRDAWDQVYGTGHRSRDPHRWAGVAEPNALDLDEEPVESRAHSPALRYLDESPDLVERHTDLVHASSGLSDVVDGSLEDSSGGVGSVIRAAVEGQLQRHRTELWRAEFLSPDLKARASTSSGRRKVVEFAPVLADCVTNLIGLMEMGTDLGTQSLREAMATADPSAFESHRRAKGRQRAHPHVLHALAWAAEAADAVALAEGARLRLAETLPRYLNACLEVDQVSRSRLIAQARWLAELLQALTSSNVTKPQRVRSSCNSIRTAVLADDGSGSLLVRLRIRLDDGEIIALEDAVAGLPEGPGGTAEHRTSTPTNPWDRATTPRRTADNERT